MLTVLIIWLTAIRRVDLTFKRNTKLLFKISGSNSTQQLVTVIFCGTKYTHRDIGLLLVRNLIEEAGKSQDRPTPTLVGRPSVAAENVLTRESSQQALPCKIVKSSLLQSVFSSRPYKAHSV